MRSPLPQTLAAAGVLLLASCAAGDRAHKAPADRPVVAVSVLPQAYFVEKLSGGRVAVLALVGPGQNPHAYDPTPRQMTELARASLWVTIGSEFEKALLPKIASLYPSLRIADGTAGIVYRRLEAHGHEEEGDHEDEGDEAGRDPHVWLGRQAVKATAAVVRDELSALLPEAAGDFRANYERFAAEVDAVYDGLAAELAPLKGKPVFVYHPAFGYLLDEFGIRQEAVETGGKEPTPKALAALIAEAKQEGARTIFVQAQFPADAAGRVAAAIGGSVVSIDPLDPDWAANIRRMGEALKASVR